MKNWITKNGATSYAIFVTAALFVICAYYVAVNASPFPEADSWDSTVRFIANFKETHDFGLFFARHNEHRIVLSKILFLLDQDLFGGYYYFLFVMNVVFALGFASLLWLVLKNSVSIEKNIFFSIIFLGPVFYLVQYSNFTWSFQSQFFLAYLIPFIAYYFWGNYQVDGSNRSFALTMLFLVLSAGTMANGVFAALPIIVLELFERRRPRILFYLFIFQVAVLTLYYQNFEFKDRPGRNFSDVLASKPLDIFEYFFGYLGSEFRYKYVAISAGIIEVLLVAFFILKFAFLRQSFGRQSALVLLPLFVFLTAALSTYGRVGLGVNQALSSRYTTPAIYCVLCIVALLYIKVGRSRSVINISIGFLMLLVLFNQFSLISTNDPLKGREFMKRAGTISVLQNSPNVLVFNNFSYPWSLQGGTIALARKEKVGIFGKSPYYQMSESNGNAFGNPVTNMECKGYVDSVNLVENDPNKYDGEQVFQIEGWIYNSDHEGRYNNLTVVQDGRVIGYGVTGYYRKDVKERIGYKERNAGFFAYTRQSLLSESPFFVILSSSLGDCRLAYPRTN